jgi:hypothetical protein
MKSTGAPLPSLHRLPPRAGDEGDPARDRSPSGGGVIRPLAYKTPKTADSPEAPVDFFRRAPPGAGDRRAAAAGDAIDLRVQRQPQGLPDALVALDDAADEGLPLGVVPLRTRHEFLHRGGRRSLVAA